MTTEIKIPDIGGSENIPVIEWHVSEGDHVEKEQPLLSLESDKAVIEIPSPVAGKVSQLLLAIDDVVSEGVVALMIDVAVVEVVDAEVSGNNAVKKMPASIDADAPTPTPALPDTKAEPSSISHASPSVRKFARELGADLSQIKGSAVKGRISKADVQAFVKAGLKQGGAIQSDGGLNLLPWPTPDFSQFGDIERQPRSRIRKISGANLHRNWVQIPHVTNHDDIDVTELEALRQQLNKEYAKAGDKVTLLAFIIKANAVALAAFPNFNASIDGDDIILKRYFHIGFAADTPRGLVVPVIRDVDKKGILEISREMAELSALAREGKLKPAQMQGGCFSISSLGGIGGSYFTPIINAPEVAILGVGRAKQIPTWDTSNGGQCVPRLIMPVSLSWDHRVVDGADAGRFLAFINQLLADFRRASL